MFIVVVIVLLLAAAQAAEETFSVKLERYIQLHQYMVNGDQPMKSITMECQFCGGWGDRVKAIFNTVALGMILDRAFFVHLVNANLPLEQVYDQAAVNWAHQGIPAATHVVNCIDKDCQCLFDSLQLDKGLQFVQRHDHIRLNINQDCSGALFRHPQFAERGAYWHHEFWRTIVWDRLFPPSPSLILAIDSTLEYNTTPPDVGIHIRTGMIPGDPLRFSISGREIVQQYYECAKATIQNLNQTRVRVFLAADNAQILQMTKVLLQQIPRVHVIDGSAIGQLGHVERYNHLPGLSLRMHTEFEILRMVPILLTGLSGYSLFAYKLRKQPHTKILASYDHCSALFTKVGEPYGSVTYD